MIGLLLRPRRADYVLAIKNQYPDFRQQQRPSWKLCLVIIALQREYCYVKEKNLSRHLGKHLYLGVDGIRRVLSGLHQGK